MRVPGQSLTEERDNYADDAISQPLLLALFMVMLAGLEWWRWYSGFKPNPLVFSLAAALAIVYAVVRILRARPRLRQLRQGIEGERAVGQYLERLRENGYVVFHDLVGSGFNIDHLIIGPGGVFTVETKTWSKPGSSDARIVFDGESIRIGSSLPDRDLLVQARAQAGWVRSLLAESTGQRIDVKGVIVFPGWFVVSAKGASKDVWVLEPKALPAFLANEPARLPADVVKLASFHLSRFIRSSEAKRR